MSQRWTIGALGLLTALTGLAGAAPATAENPAKTRFYHAGLELTLPDGFVLRRPGEVFEVFQAARPGRDARPDIAITLAALPVTPETTLEAFADSILQEQALPVKKLEIVAGESLSVGDLPALQRRLSYTFRGQPAEAERVFWLRDIPGQQEYRLGYLLTIEAQPGQAGELTGLRERLLASLELIEVQSPGAAPLQPAGEPVALHEPFRLTLRLPRDWKLQAGPRAFKAVQVNYLAGGMSYPALTITIHDAPAGATAQQCAEQALAAGQRLWEQQEFTILSQAPTQVADQAAHQALSRIALEGHTLISAQRFVVRDGRCLTFSLAELDAHPQTVQAMLQTLVETITFTPPAATAPAP